ncbi:cytochrome b/b6 domain-containing protein [Erythrobacter sp. F6033]|uniref:cytochrome b/b6 domain-containing protein n=1 Tax=Erythrobacter sp. F6033 TaxID=2926401 RepID=UPI001FF35C06|nr:cytochrome b/b6 domain-containing protein [Erythrobacter sp. F6033]MCK0127924.1 cytochrome b/b6 domain-containing protein [Erythrobacter sp. F6033]
MAKAPTRLIKVWDLPLRLTKWSFVGLVAAMWYTAENSLWYWHTRLGMVLFALLIFRIIWGFIGTRTARFRQFVRSPPAALAYLRGKETGFTIGHNPLGAFAVLALIAVMLAQVMMGLFAGDPYDGATGPLNSLVGVMTADTITDLHEDFLWVVLGMAGLHIIAVSIYTFIKRANLIGPMITGKREELGSVEGIEAVPWGRAAIAFAVSTGLALWIWLGAPPLT